VGLSGIETNDICFFMAISDFTVLSRDAEAGSGTGGSGPFSVEADAEARKSYPFRFHIGYLT